MDAVDPAAASASAIIIAFFLLLQVVVLWIVVPVITSAALIPAMLAALAVAGRSAATIAHARRVRTSGVGLRSTVDRHAVIVVAAALLFVSVIVLGSALDTGDINNLSLAFLLLTLALITYIAGVVAGWLGNDRAHRALAQISVDPDPIHFEETDDIGY